MASGQAVAEVFVAHRGRVESMAAGILQDRDEARDVASDAFLALLERGPDAEYATKWLFVTTRHRALNRVRDLSRARRWQNVLVQEDEQPPESRSDGLAILHKAIERLPQRYAQALRLRYMEDMDYPDLAKALRCSVRQARVVAHRAARRLRLELIHLLADHHRASPECREILAARLAGPGIPDPGHEGCNVCTAVADDLSGLAAHGWLPLLTGWVPALGRVFDRVVAPIVSRTPRWSLVERISEALAALLIATVGATGAAGSADRLPPSAAAIVQEAGAAASSPTGAIGGAQTSKGAAGGSERPAQPTDPGDGGPSGLLDLPVLGRGSLKDLVPDTAEPIVVDVRDDPTEDLLLDASS